VIPAARSPERRRPWPLSGEFFAPVPLALVALLLINDNFLKARWHSEVTGKLSDIAVCFFMPLFLSELLGIVFLMPPRTRLWVGAAAATVLYVGLEIVAPFTRFAIHILGCVGPYVGIRRGFVMTSDWTDLLCLPLIPLAVLYGRRRLLCTPRAPPAAK
jgi:hypothetical protein